MTDATSLSPVTFRFLEKYSSDDSIRESIEALMADYVIPNEVAFSKTE